MSNTDTVTSAQPPISLSSSTTFYCKFCKGPLGTANSRYTHQSKCRLNPKNMNTEQPKISSNNGPLLPTEDATKTEPDLIITKDYGTQATVSTTEAGTQTDITMTALNDFFEFQIWRQNQKVEPPVESKIVKDSNIQEPDTRLQQAPKRVQCLLTRAEPLQAEPLQVPPMHILQPISSFEELKYDMREGSNMDINMIEEIDYIDCSDQVIQLYNEDQCNKLHETLLSLKQHRHLIDQTKANYLAFKKCSFEKEPTQQQIIEIINGQFERLIYNATQSAKLDRKSYLQAWLSLRLANNNYHKKILVNLKPFIEKYKPWSQAFTNKDLQITIIDLLGGTSDEIQQRIDQHRGKLTINIDHYTELLNYSIDIMKLMPKVLPNMSTTDIEGFLEHIKQCDHIKHIPYQERSLRFMVEHDVYYSIFQLLCCALTHTISCSKILRCKVLDQSYSYSFQCETCHFTLKVGPMYIPEVLQGLVKHKRLQKIDRQKLVCDKQKTSSLLGNICNYEYLRKAQDSDTHIYSEEQPVTQQLPAKSDTLTPIRALNGDPKLLFPQKVEDNFDFEKAFENYTKPLDEHYNKLIGDIGILKLDEFSEACHQRIKVCVLKRLTGLRTKKIDWKRYSIGTIIAPPIIP